MENAGVSYSLRKDPRIYIVKVVAAARSTLAGNTV